MEASIANGNALTNSVHASPIIANESTGSPAPVRTNEWASGMSSTNSKPETSPNGTPLGVTADEAIRAALDAMTKQTPGELAPNSRSYGPLDYQTTTQPNGISDWSKYFPAEYPPAQTNQPFAPQFQLPEAANGFGFEGPSGMGWSAQ
jgi:hypothetical protein